MILIGLGANLPSPAGDPAETLEHVLRLLEPDPVRLAARSRLYRSRAVAAMPQPDYVNAVARLDTALGPKALLAHLMELETRFGRVRRTQDEPRSLDLDLLDYHGTVTHPRGAAKSTAGDGGGLDLPHPRMDERAFVLLPLLDVAPDWRHPVSGESARALLADCKREGPMPVPL